MAFVSNTMDLVYTKVEDGKVYVKENVDLEKIKAAVEALRQKAVEKGTELTEATKTKIHELKESVEKLELAEKASALVPHEKIQASKEALTKAYQVCLEKLEQLSQELAAQKSRLVESVDGIKEGLKSYAVTKYTGLREYSEKSLLPRIRGTTSYAAASIDTKFGVIGICEYLLLKAKSLDDNRFSGRITSDAILPVYGKAKQLDDEYIGGAVGTVVVTVTDDFTKAKSEMVKPAPTTTTLTAA